MLQTQIQKLIALDLGSGHIPITLDGYEVISVDTRQDMEPMICCDLRKLPFDDNSIDLIYSSHVLEHFAFSEIHDIFKEWLRVLKVGGDIMIRLPDITYAAKKILAGEYDIIAQAVLYGQQDYDLNFHKCGFTPKFLAEFLKQFPVKGKIISNQYVHDMIFEGVKIDG